ncbi:photosystem II stability/assembly factor-like uncharacterized protein [Paraburkholderia sp. GAS448]|uniref:WD40/YVTN/BNR-like repeat-containing protein n=1 Tax=Paraburkholderia sp. GAS448 TaxID=3035136 RepID=UPI003D19936D
MDLSELFKMRFLFACVSVTMTFLCMAIEGHAAGSTSSTVFKDPLVTPADVRASVTVNLSAQPILALAKVNEGSRERIIAAGLHGVILFSDDGGTHWRQGLVPVQSDLVSLSFVSPKQGWAVGHEGVILHTDDGGQTWKKQFDGEVAQDTLVSSYKTRIANGEKGLQPYLDEVELNTKSGPTWPFLSVYFESDQIGYAVGSFGMLVRTVDGGKTWQPWLDHIDNANFLHLSDIRKIGHDIYIAGEQGTVYRLDREQQRFIAISPGYKGSFFHIVGNERFLLAIGLNGTAFRSVDGGQKWEAVNTGVRTNLTSAALSVDDKVVVLTGESGQVIYSTDDARTFGPLHVDKPMLFADVVAGSGDWFVFAGYQGIERKKFRPVQNLTGGKV